LAAAWDGPTLADKPSADKSSLDSASVAAATATPPAWQLAGATFTALATVGAHATVGDHAVDSDAVVAGTEAGEVWLVNADGTVAWQQQVAGAVTAVTSAHFGERGTVIAVGTHEATVSLFTLAGERLWDYRVPFYKRTGIVRTLVAADLDGDGRDEIVVGAENWHHYVLDQQGEKRWHFESVHASTATAVADIDNDGQPELIAATEYNWWFAVSNQGEQRWQHNTIGGMGVTHVATARQPDGTHLVAFGCRDGTVQVVDAAGKLQFVLRSADTITGLAVADIDGDGAEEFLVASAMQNTYAVSSSGDILWRFGNESPPTHLQVTGPTDAPQIFVAEHAGTVRSVAMEGQTTVQVEMNEAATAFTLVPTSKPQLCVAALPSQGLVAWRVST